MSIYFKSKKSAYQVNLIPAYNHSSAPQLSGNSISMLLYKLTKRRPLTLISSNLTIKDLRAINKRL